MADSSRIRVSRSAMILAGVPPTTSGLESDQAAFDPIVSTFRFAAP